MVIIALLMYILFLIVFIVFWGHVFLLTQSLVILNHLHVLNAIKQAIKAVWKHIFPW